MGGSFTQWDYDRVRDVFDPWASLSSCPTSLHTGYELRGDVGVDIKAAPRLAAGASFRDESPGGCFSPAPGPHAVERGSLPPYQDSASDSSLSTDSDSISGSPRIPSHPRDSSTELRQQNVELKKALKLQQEQISELRLQVSSLRGEIATTTGTYERLLGRVMSAPNNVTQPPTFQPFFRILKFARSANSKLPAYRRENYVGQFYWTEESFLNERWDGASALTVIRNECSGPVPFLVGEDGVVVSGRRQQQLFHFGRILYNTLLKYEMAPGTWDDIDVYALEWFCLAIRVKCLEFRLCDDHWKAEAFAAMNYGKWSEPCATTSSGHSAEWETPRLQEVQITKTDIRWPPQISQSVPDSRTGSPVRKEIAIQVSWQSDTCSQVLPEPGDCGYLDTSSRVHSEDMCMISDFPPVFEDEEDNDGTVDHSGGSFSSTRWSMFTSPNLAWSKVDHNHGEDPPDYSELQAEERSRAAATSKIIKEKRQQLEILKNDATYKAKPRRKEKKQCHVHARKELENFISSCLDDIAYERERAKRLERSEVQRLRAAKSKANVRRRQSGWRVAVREPTEHLVRKAQTEQSAWVLRADIQQRLDGFVKYVDHVERAYRTEERFLLTRKFAEELASDDAEFVVKHGAASESENAMSVTEARLSRMLPDFSLYRGMVINQRVKEFRRKQIEAAKKIAEEKAERLRDRREREAREVTARVEAARQRMEAKMRETRERLAVMQQRSSATESVSKKSKHEANAPSFKPAESESEAVHVSPKHRHGASGSHTKPVTERGDTQAEVRTKAQAEFQARMKARLEAQALASANRQRELEHTFALEEARRKMHRAQVQPSSTIPAPLTSGDALRSRSDTASTTPSTSYIPSPPTSSTALSTSANASDVVVQKRVSGWRSQAPPIATGVSSTAHTVAPGTPPPTRDSKATLRQAKSLQAPPPVISPHDSTSMPPVKAIDYAASTPTSARPQRTVELPSKGWRSRQQATPFPMTAPRVADHLPEANVTAKQPKNHPTTVSHSASYNVWRPAGLAKN